MQNVNFTENNNNNILTFLRREMGYKFQLKVTSVLNQVTEARNCVQESRGDDPGGTPENFG